MFATIALIIITCIISYRGLKNELFISRYSFSIEKVRVYKEYIRLVSSGFLHINWMHLVVNMFVLWAFGSGLEARLGIVPFLLIYFSSLVGGNLLALWIHKYDDSYASVGASGAVAGLIFASIAIVPQWRIFFLPSWIFGIVYVLYTIYAIRSQRTDVGHAAHLGGALIGMAVAVLMYPLILVSNWLPILAILLPGIALIVIMIRKPELILIDKRTQERQLTVEDRYNISRKQQKEEVDRILEKISQKGMDSLTKKEKETLDEYSRS
ncbi:MAG TPA: rhomboid family intramembrane serine protease [Flavipsychrobacter sp.]|jgi:membrane associated rhomboid family serine protease|nr:rhomboid family intramembrane serine protease [Flavipsychrobacter sp.]